MNKSNPWDNVISQMEWEESVTKSAKDPGKTTPIEAPDSLEEELDVEMAPDFSDFADIISAINSDNAAQTQALINEESNLAAEQAAQAALAEKKRQDEENLRRYEHERMEKEAREFEEAEEFARRKREEIERKEKSFVGRLSLKTKKSKKPVIEDTNAIQKNEKLSSDIEEPVQGIVQTPEPQKEKATNNGTFSDFLDPELPIEEYKKGPVLQERVSSNPIESTEEIIKPQTNTANVTQPIPQPSVESVDIKQPAIELNVQNAQENTSAPSTNAEATTPVEQKPKKKSRFLPFINITVEEEEISNTVENKTPEKPEEASVNKKEEPASTDWEFLATHDEMTGLLNARAYAVEKARPKKGPFAVVYADVNNLKYANDKFSHEVGNLLIKSTADAASQCFPGQAFRTGGDEFIVIIDKINPKNAEENLEASIASARAALDKATASAPKGVVVAASFGYAVAEKGETFESVAGRAEKAMYADKAAYKKAHPEFDVRGEFKKKPQNPDETPKSNATDEDYDSRLTKEQQLVKHRIQDGHKMANPDEMARIVAEVQNRASEVRAILIASPTFDYLFIISTVDMFTSLVIQMQNVIDYSYLYVLYQGGPQYYGADEYYAEVTDIFTAIGKGILAGKLKSEKDYAKIKGINIFKQVRFA